ncbi:hypothetical protein CC1G_01104 [Coprinopsis cinerea okayama7|uniref:Uncharacterized protein n=1 Tax=Coprinopsis cinerea (strain Okayama-7 / 130 / ATCC MYA-4618 / FGSC 9003) TaxID=240176 RepID=A8NEJ0_COPC7|nr:hypothetical protein CC1G_01104 [Coprinopsis cinerea okayama7\|eukprot:XP_001833042.1 hypothetical protein CC1G_01104 [Coprinopsis cinerea okayama7\
MGQEPWWDWIQLSELYAQLDTSLKPGDLAYTFGSLQFVFYQFVEKQGYKLTTLERLRAGIYQAQARPCIVKRCREDGRYEVYLLTTFGSSGVNLDHLSPVAQFFGVPLGGSKHPSSSMPLEILGKPTWDSDITPYVFGIPVITDCVNPWTSRGYLRLASRELDRLNNVSDLQMERFHVVQAQLRKAYWDWKTEEHRKKMTSQSQKLKKDVASPDLKASSATAQLYQPSGSESTDVG